MEAQKPTASQLLSRAEIHDTMMRYLRGCDRKDWELIRSAYYPDAHHFHGAVDGTVEDLIRWIESPHGGMHHLFEVNGVQVERIPQVMHFIGNMSFEFASDTTAIVESYAVTLQVERLPDGQEQFVQIGLRYVDRFEKRQADWKIAQRVVALVYRTPPVPVGSVDGPRKPGGPLASRRDRTDPLWEMRAAAGLS